MSDDKRPTPSALQAWASMVLSGGDRTGREAEVERAPGHAQYDPADVISVFMSARESAKLRIPQAPRPPSGTQPS